MSETPAQQAHPTAVWPVMEARFGLDGGAMFGIIPRPLWSKTNPPDDNNRIDMACRCLLVQWSDGRHALVDVGIGTRWSAKERDIYAIHAQDDAMQQALAAHALTPQNIDDVIITHLHFDHVGGLARAAGDDGGVVANFLNARHWVQRRNWSWAHAPSARDQGSYRPEDFAFLEEDGAPPLHLIDGIAEPLPGVEVLPHHGHTHGMQVVKIALPSYTMAFVADLIPTTSHMRDPYVMGYDLQPATTVEEKRALLYEASRHDWVLAFEHDAETPFARVEFKDGRPHAVPVDLDDLLAE